MTRVWIHGISGRMGQELKKTLASRKDLVFAGGSDESAPVDLHAADLYLDFSTPAGNSQLLDAFLSAKGLARRSILVGTTGLQADSQGLWRTFADKAGHSLLLAPNTSVGLLVVAKTAQTLARTLTDLHYDIEITETHHRHKKDAPSGTAKLLADAVHGSVKTLTPVFNRAGERGPNEIGISSVRGGGVFGEHEVRLIGDHDEVRLAHRAFSRQLFAEGALVLGRWLTHQKPGHYELMDVNLEALTR